MNARYIFFLLLLLTACTLKKNNVYQKKFQFGPERKEIEVHEIDYNTVDVTKVEGLPLGLGTVLNTPTNIEVVDSYLVVSDLEDKKLLLVYSLESNEVIGKYITRGRGPNELLSIQNIDNYPKGSKHIWLYDFNKKSLNQFVLDSIQDSLLVFNSIIKLGTLNGPVLFPDWLNDSTIVATGFFQNGRFANFDSKGRKKGFNATPIRIVENSPSYFYDDRILQAKSEPKPNGKKVAVVNRFTNFIEIYDHSEALEYLIMHKDYFKPGYQIKNKKLLGTKGKHYAYIDVKATDKFIYALYSGELSSVADANSGQYVEILDWNGSLVSVLKLDSKVYGIAVDEVSGYLYGIRLYPKVDIVQYKL